MDSVPGLLRPLIGGWFVHPAVSRLDITNTLLLKSRQVKRACQVRDMLGWPQETRTRGIQVYLDAIDTYLSDKLLAGGDDAEPIYLFDKGKPTLVDATVFGFLVCLLMYPT